MAENKKRNQKPETAMVAIKWAVPVVLFAIALFITFCYIVQDPTAQFSYKVAGALRGLFSYSCYMIPPLLIIQAIFFSSDLKKKRLIPRIILSILLLASTSMLIHTIWFWPLSSTEMTIKAAALYNDAELRNIGGGLVGGALAIALRVCVGVPGIIILFATVLILYAVFFISKSNNPIAVIGQALLYAFVKSAAKVEKRIKTKIAENKTARRIRAEEKRRQIEKKKHKKIEKKAEALMEKEADLYEDEFFEVDNGLKEFKIDDLGIKETRSDADLEKNPSFQEKVFHPSRVENEPGSHKVNTRKPFNTDYGMDMGDEPYTSVTKHASATKNPMQGDDSADSVFSEDFDEFDCEANVKFASMQSSAPEKETENTTPRFEKHSFSEDDIAAARRRADFNYEKTNYRASTAPYEATRHAENNFAPATFEFDINPDKAPIDDVYARQQGYGVSNTFNEETATQNDFAQQADAHAYRRAAEYATILNDQAAERAAAERAAAERAVTEATYEESENKDFIDGFDFDTDENDQIFTGDENEPAINIASLLGDDDDSDEDVFTFTTDTDDEDVPPEKQNPLVSEYQKMFSIFEEKEEDDDDYASKATFDDDEDTAENDDNRPLFTYGEDIDDDSTEDVPFDFDTVTDEDDGIESKNGAQKPDYSSFEFPPIDILKKGFEEEDPTIAEEIAENGEKLIDALAQFDVRASIKSVDRGPRITRYEIVPARGVRVSKVIGLFDDIALNLAAEGIRMEAPIPGKSAIGVEIPNKHPSTVFLRDLLESDEFMNESSKTFACFGKDVTGNPVFGDIAKMPHMLVAGATGMGKSVCINSILISILYKARPDEVKFIMIDPKTVEFTMYNGIPHLLVPVVTDAKQAAGALMWAIDEMNRRYELMAKHEVRKLDSYNDIVRENPSLGEVLPKIIIVIDELNDLMQQVRRPVEGLITNITQKARAAGIHMIIGTQRPSVDVITGVIKANVPSRVSCKVTSFTDSKTILDQAGAEKLLDKGDMLFAPVGKPKPIRVQGAFVADSEVEKIMKFLKSNVKGNIYDERALEDMIRAAQKCNKGKDSVDGIDEDEKSEEGVGYLNDKQFLEAVDLAIKQGKISTSLIQRKISVGYGKAAKFIDIMEEMGLVSEPNGSKPRDVLVTRDEWHEMLSRRSLDD